MVPLRLTSLACALGVGVVLTTTMVSPRASAATDVCALPTGLQQLVNHSTAGNLLTTYQDEADGAVQKYGFTAYGVVAKVSRSAAEGLVAVQRMNKGADFLWAATEEQRAAGRAAGYVEGAPPFYAASSASASCLAPVYQLTRDGMHRIAVGQAARDKLVAAGWGSTETVFYAVPTKTDVDVEQPSTGPTGPTSGPLPPANSDTKFSIAVIPDTQNETNNASDRRMINRSNWLVDNKKALDLRFVTHIGDVVNWDTPDHNQFTNAARSLLPVQANIPMALAIGNHDTGAVCPGGSACPGKSANETVRDTTTFNAYFSEDRFGALAGQFEAGKVDNAYHAFRAGNRDWLVLNLELWPRKEVITWAKKVVADNPKRNVIIVTHSYLNSDGSISTSNGGYGATSPKYLYDNLVKLYPNIKLVLSGHVGQGKVRTDTGTKGNQIVSMLQGFHHASNPVRLIEIDTSANTLKTWVYVPDKKATLSEYDKKVSKMVYVR